MLIQGQDVDTAMAFGQNDQGGVRKPEIEIRKALQDSERRADVVARERFELIGGPNDLPKKGPRRAWRYPRGQEVIEFSQDERRQQAWRAGTSQCPGSRLVAGLRDVQGRQQTTRVGG